MGKTVIIGAGLTGLSCAYKLNSKSEYIIFEKENRVGGLASSLEKDGFIFDYSGHLLHLRWTETTEFILRILKGNYLKIKRNSQIYFGERFIDYPFQINLYNLPDKIKKKCVLDFIKTYKKRKKYTTNFKQWALQTFGKSICQYFMFPYNEKLFSYSIDKITTEWLGEFVPKPDIKNVIYGAYIGKVKNTGYNHTFYYPEYGGINTLTKNISEKVKNINLNSEIRKINLRRKEVYVNGNWIKFNWLLNTMPLKYFIYLIEDAPSEIKKQADNLKHNEVYILNIGIKKSDFKQHWIYFPEKKFLFYRIGFYSNFSKYVAPKNTSSVYVEISNNPSNSLNINETEKKIIKQIKKTGIIKKESDIITKMWTKIPVAYVIYDKKRNDTLKKLNDFLLDHNIISTGRYGGWKYSFMEENVKDGFEAAKVITRGK